MLYVSEITSQGRPCRYVSASVYAPVDIVIRDSATDEVVPDQPGVVLGREFAGGSTIYIRHSRRDAQFFECLESVKALETSDCRDYWKDIEHLLDNPIPNVETVRVDDEAVTLIGNSIRSISPEHTRVEFCPLYEFVLRLIKGADWDILSKRVLLIDSGMFGNRFLMTLKHTPEADRFFTKMRLLA